MPWHDIHCCINGPAASDVAHNFVSKWNHHRSEEKNSALPPIPVWPGPFCNPWQFPGGWNGSKAQVVRSLGGWAGSPGQSTEKSIYNAYEKLIKGAKHYIYMENQVRCGVRSLRLSFSPWGLAARPPTRDPLDVALTHPPRYIRHYRARTHAWHACPPLPLLPHSYLSVLHFHVS